MQFKSTVRSRILADESKNMTDRCFHPDAVDFSQHETFMLYHLMHCIDVKS
jgi:hypothetical protein